MKFPGRLSEFPNEQVFQAHGNSSLIL